MSVDALALLKIRGLVIPSDIPGAGLPVAHHGDASVISTFINVDSLAPDEFALTLRNLLGPLLDAHDDPRGILIFPDLSPFRGKSYRAIVKQVEAAGFWAPKVDADHVPARYTQAQSGTHDELVARMIEQMGRAAALDYDLVAQVHAISELTGTPSEEGAAHGKTLADALGAEFAARYAESLRALVRQDHERREETFATARELHARSERGEPLVTPAGVGEFLESSAGDALLRNLDPSVRERLEKQLSAVDASTLAPDDLGNVLRTALERTSDEIDAPRSTSKKK
jgi:hypothetical protein